MSVQYQDLTQLLAQLMNSNNAIRSTAEKQFEGFYEQQTMIMMSLLLDIFMNFHENIVLRTFSTILLRRGIEKYYEKLSQEFLHQFREKLVMIFQQLDYHVKEQQGLLMKLFHVLAQTAFKMEWKELVPIILANQSAEQLLKLLNFLEVYVDYCPEDISQHYAVIGQFLIKIFASTDASPQHFPLRLASCRTTAAIVSVLEDDNARNLFKPALQSILQVIELSLQRDLETEVSKIIEYLVTVAQVQPLFFKESFALITGNMLTIVNNENFEFSTRSIALELLITISESAPALARRATGFIENMIRCIFQILLDIDDDEKGWARGKYNENDDCCDENCLIGEEAIERLSAGLGGKSVAEIILKYVSQFSSNNQDWRYRRAAIVATCRLAEGATKYFHSYLAQIMTFLLTSLQDPLSVRVQYEAIQTIGQLATLYNDDASDLLDKFLPILATMMATASNCAKIRGHSASALINLLNPEHVENEMLEKYLEPLLQALIVTIQSSPHEVQSPCLSILGCVAQACPEAFVPYYDQFMPGIKRILLEASSTELVELRGKAMECAGLIGDAVGIDKFSSDAIEIMRLFFHLMQQNVDADVTFDYILPACARIAKAIKQDFIQYLPHLYPILLAGANQPIQFAFEDADEDEVEGQVTHNEDTGTESAIITIGGGMKKRITVNTHSIQQKNQATKVLYEFADSLGVMLGEYLIPTLDSLLVLLVEKHSNDIRFSTASGLAKVMESLILIMKNPQASLSALMMTLQPAQQQQLIAAFSQVNLAEYFHKSMIQLVEAIQNEPDHQTKSVQVECIRDILDKIYETGNEEANGSRNSGFIIPISEQINKILCDFLLLSCAESVHKRNQIIEKLTKANQNEIIDNEDGENGENEELENEEDILTVFIDIIGHLLKLQQATFMPIFNHNFAGFAAYLSPQEPTSLRRIVTCLMDDVVEFGGKDAWQYIPSLLPIYYANTQSTDLLLQQSSMYGLAMIVCKHPELLLTTKIPNKDMTYIGPLLTCFQTSILRPEAMEEDYAGITENAIFGLMNFMAHPSFRDEIVQHGATHNPQRTYTIYDLYSLVLKKLPLKLDGIELKLTMVLLCSMIERNDAILFTKNNDTGNFLFVNDLLRIFGDVLAINNHGDKAKISIVQASPASVAAVDDNDTQALMLPEVTKQKMNTILSQFQSAKMINPAQLQEFPLHIQSVLRQFC